MLDVLFLLDFLIINRHHPLPLTLHLHSKYRHPPLDCNPHHPHHPHHRHRLRYHFPVPLLPLPLLHHLLPLPLLHHFLPFLISLEELW